MYRDLLRVQSVKDAAARLGLDKSAPGNNSQFFLYTTLTDMNFAGYNYELSNILGLPRYATVTNQTLYKLIQTAVRDSFTTFNLRPILPYVAEGTHLSTIS